LGFVGAAGGTVWLGIIARHCQHSSDMARWCLSGMEGHFLPTASISPPSLSSHIFMPGIAAFTTSLLISIIYPSMLLLSIVTCHPQDGLIFRDLDLKLDVKDTKNRIRFSLDFPVRIYGSSLHTPINACLLFIEVCISLCLFSYFMMVTVQAVLCQA